MVAYKNPKTYQSRAENQPQDVEGGSYTFHCSGWLTMHVAIKAHAININTTEDKGESSSRSGTLGGLYNEMPSNPGR